MNIIELTNSKIPLEDMTVTLFAFQAKGADCLRESFWDLSGNGNHVGSSNPPDPCDGWQFGGVVELLKLGGE